MKQCEIKHCRISVYMAKGETAPAKAPCSKCGEGPRIGGTNPWCLDCQAEYQAIYRVRLIERAKTEGFAAGVAAMRAVVMHRFRQFPLSAFNGSEVAATVQMMENPRPATDQT